MRLLKSYSMFTVLVTAMLMSACDNENPCPGVELEVDIDSANQFVNIKANGLEGLAFELFVNDSLVKSFSGEIDTTEFAFEFETGEYKVCIVAESESCDRKIEGCAEFEIRNPNKEKCLGLEFRTDKQNENYYKFYAEFDGEDTLAYVWVIDGDVVKDDPPSADRKNYLGWQFGPGEHNVCIVAENDACGEVKYCEEIFVERFCADSVSFEIERDAENMSKYYFYSNFEGKEHTKYKWYVNDDFVDLEDPINGNADHKLAKEFANGTYNICLVSDQDGCEELEFCETIVVESQTTDCVELSYSAVLTETDSTDFYTFTADFENKNEVTYIWKVFINDDFQHQEVRQAGSEADHTFVWHLDPGVQYEVCLKQDECDNNQVCKNFSVD